MARPVPALAAAVTLVAVLSAAVPPAAGQTAQLAGPDGLLGAAQVETDSVLLHAELRPDGAAEWRIEYRTRLDDENTTAAFDALADDVSANRSAFTDRFAERMRRTVRTAEESTGREMALRDVSVETDRTALPAEYGIVRYTFTWEGFAAVDAETIRAGDAVAGLFLDESTSFRLSWPDGYRLVEADPSPDEGSPGAVTWRGPTEFTGDEPRLELAAGTPTATDTGTGPPGGEGPDGSNTLFLLVGGIAVVGLGLGAGWFLLRSRGNGPAGGGADGDGPDEPPDDLLSNEERVLKLLEENDGRMKQQQVVEALGWTDAKTSQVVGKLRDDGRIEGFRLGRENVLSLPDIEGPGSERSDDGE